MLYIFENLFFLAIIVFVITQMIWPGLTGKPLFPLFHTRKREKQLTVVKRLREDLELQKAIDEIIADLGGQEVRTDAEREAAMERIKSNTAVVAAKMDEVAQAGNDALKKE